MSEFAEILEQFADLVASKLAVQLQRNHGSATGQRLLPIDQAAVYIGRTKEAVQYLVAAGKLPTVRSDRRVFLDIRGTNGSKHTKSILTESIHATAD